MQTGRAHNLYLFLGDDHSAKQEEFQKIKASCLDPLTQEFNAETVDAQDARLTPPRFSESLRRVPAAGARTRLTMVRRAHKLSKENQDVLAGYLEKPSQDHVLVFDSEDLFISKDSLWEKHKHLLKIISFGGKKPADIFDLMDLLKRGHRDKALGVLNEIFKTKEDTAKILGALSWYWQKQKKGFSAPQYKNGLNLILETDLKIKTGKSLDRMALEILLVKLSYLF